MTEGTMGLELTTAQRLNRYISSIPILVILLVTLLASVGETVHTRLLEVGGRVWSDYTHLRLIDQIKEPDCVLISQDDIELAVEDEVTRQQEALADDPFAEVFGGNIDRNAIRNSLTTQNLLCEEQKQIYKRIRSEDSWQVRAYATAELALSHFVTLVTGNRQVILGFMILFCAAAATLKREQISLRLPETQRDEFMSCLTQALSNGILMVSAIVYRQQEYANVASGMQVPHLFMHDVFVVGFFFLTAIPVYQLLNPKKYAEKGSWGRSLLAIPLYSYMTFNAIFNFASYGFYHGMLVYMNILMEMAAVFINVGLYVWVGVLLARTTFPQKVFNLIRVWRLPPKWLCLVMLIITSPPTAYTGASAVLILAAGPAIFQELRRAGTSEPLTRATIAIAGSMGTTLRPCLLVLIIASINSSVTTDEIYYAGVQALWISLVVFAFFVFIMGGKTSSHHKMAPMSEALPATLIALRPLLPYVSIFGGVVLFWYWALGRPMDEFSAPAILPISMLLVLAYERMIKKEPDPDPNPEEAARSATTGQAIARASAESAPLIGALVMLISLSMSTGGMIERSGLLELFPESIGSIWFTLTVLMVILIGIGMVMDPYGAIILVNATLFPWAITNGIDPMHFWIVTIMAFEVGYLTPPVALNHLIARQVIGPPVEWESLHGSVWQRYYHLIFPIVVMGVSLAAVAYLPLIFPNILG